ncbi:hypothetical protein F5Y16DRAFT_401535 [Xylariaceae sp. FL0255]|nr:hypothetical protein F5Y16DRAFT_401535 [Xylariaceae sp. FL0255]
MPSAQWQSRLEKVWQNAATQIDDNTRSIKLSYYAFLHLGSEGQQVFRQNADRLLSTKTGFVFDGNHPGGRVYLGNISEIASLTNCTVIQNASEHLPRMIPQPPTNPTSLSTPSMMTDPAISTLSPGPPANLLGQTPHLTNPTSIPKKRKATDEGIDEGRAGSPSNSPDILKPRNPCLLYCLWRANAIRAADPQIDSKRVSILCQREWYQDQEIRAPWMALNREEILKHKSLFAELQSKPGMPSKQGNTTQGPLRKNPRLVQAQQEFLFWQKNHEIPGILKERGKTQNDIASIQSQQYPRITQHASATPTAVQQRPIRQVGESRNGLSQAINYTACRQSTPRGHNDQGQAPQAESVAIHGQIAHQRTLLSQSPLTQAPLNQPPLSQSPVTRVPPTQAPLVQAPLDQTHPNQASLEQSPSQTPLNYTPRKPSAQPSPFQQTIFSEDSRGPYQLQHAAA